MSLFPLHSSTLCERVKDGSIEPAVDSASNEVVFALRCWQVSLHTWVYIYIFIYHSQMDKTKVYCSLCPSVPSFYSLYEASSNCKQTLKMHKLFMHWCTTRIANQSKWLIKLSFICTNLDLDGVFVFVASIAGSAGLVMSILSWHANCFWRALREKQS